MALRCIWRLGNASGSICKGVQQRRRRVPDIGCTCMDTCLDMSKHARLLRVAQITRAACVGAHNIDKSTPTTWSHLQSTRVNGWW